MPDRSKTRPRDPNHNQLAYQIMLESTGQAPKTESPDKAKNPHAVALGRLGGLKGSAARAAVLTPMKRSQIAAKAAKAVGYPEETWLTFCLSGNNDYP
jgi:hypothetical protein